MKYIDRCNICPYFRKQKDESSWEDRPAYTYMECSLAAEVRDMISERRKNLYYSEQSELAKDEWHALLYRDDPPYPDTLDPSCPLEEAYRFSNAWQEIQQPRIYCDKAEIINKYKMLNHGIKVIKKTKELEKKDSKTGTTGNDIAAASVLGIADCFIITAALGNPLHPIVVDFRIYRDKILTRSIFGRFFIKLYYKVGPILAKPINQHKFLRIIVRCFFVEPLHESVKNIIGH
jgi:hypothetical protein